MSDRQDQVLEAAHVEAEGFLGGGIGNLTDGPLAVRRQHVHRAVGVDAAVARRTCGITHGVHLARKRRTCVHPTERIRLRLCI